MTRVKKGTHALKRRKKVLSATKGFRHARSTKERAAHDALLHAYAYAFVHRKDKKSDFRKLFNVKINAGTRELGLSYSKFIGGLKKKGIALDRKILASLAENNPRVFKKVVEAL